MFLLAFRLALLASTNLVECDAEDAFGAIAAGVETAVNLADGFSGVEAPTCGCDGARSLFRPLLLAALGTVLTVAELDAELFAVTLSEDWRRYQPPAPTSNRAPAAIAPIKNFLLDGPDLTASSDRPSCTSARKWVPNDEAGTPRLALSGVSVISVSDRSSTFGISPKSSTASCPPISGKAAETAAALRAKGSSQEGILISSESSMDLDGGAEVFGVTTGAAVGVFIGFAASRASGLATLDEDGGGTFSEAGGEFVEADCVADG